MTWSGARLAGIGNVRATSAGRRVRRRASSWAPARRAARRAARRGRRLVALGLAPAQGVLPSIQAITLTVAAATTAAAAALLAAPAVPARASVSGSVLILSTSVNGGSSSAEAQQAAAAGLTVTVDTPTQWDALTQANFAAFNAIIIGDPSATSCATTVPADALSTAGTWGPAVTGNVAVLGTAPALAGATMLIQDAIAYAASGSGTGLYVSLNCEYSTASAGTSVPLLAYVDDGGAQAGANVTVTGQSAGCPSAAGTVNTWQALANTQFNGLAAANLGPWSSPACSVEETFNAWPAGLGGLAYDTGASPATFTASDGATGQAYILSGPALAANSTTYAATTALAPSTGGQVPAGTAGAGSNMAAPGVNQAVSDGVNTATGDFTQSATDLSVATFGPSLDFTRSYDAQVAQQQAKTGTPGPMGYGWTSNWSSSLAATAPAPGDIYTIDGLRTNTGDGGPPTGVLGAPDRVVTIGSDVYIVDLADNRIQEIPGTSKTQWGQSMTAGDMYTVAGSPSGVLGMGNSGSPLSGFLLNAPAGLTFDSSGNMIIADSGNQRVLVVPAASGTYFGVSMTAGNVYRIAGQGGTAGTAGDGGPAKDGYLSNPQGVSMGHGTGDLYIADAGNNRVQEIYEGGQSWGQSGMVTSDVYTVAGQASGSGGNNGAGGPATSALLNTPEDVSFSSAGDMYIAVTGNNKVQEVASAGGSQWGGISMTANDIYNIAGQANGTAGTGGDGSSVTSGNLFLNSPIGIELNNGKQLYITDAGNNRIQEVAQTTHTEWGISMTQFDMYTIAGSASGSCGFSGNGGLATSAKLCYPTDVAVGSSSMYIADESNNRVRLVDSADTISAYAGNGWQVATAGNSGPAINAGLFNPEGEAFDAAGDIYIADAWNNRIQEIAAYGHTQFGINMTGGDVYTVAGNSQAASGHGGDGGAATSAFLFLPQSIAIDSAGNLYVADSDNCRVQKVSASTGNISTIAGGSSGPGACGTYTSAMDGNLATSASLSQIQGVAVDSAGDVYIADTFNNRVEEVYASGGQAFGRSSSTSGDIYTIAGTGTAGFSGDTGAATSAEVSDPDALGVDGTGNVYVSDWGNNRIREVPVTTGAQRGQSMTRYDIYTIAGNGGTGTAGNGGPATSANLNGPGNATVDAAGNLYVSDTANNRVQEVPVASGTQWGQAMTANYAYTVAGSATGSSGSSGDGGPATSARFTVAENVSLDPQGDMYITDKSNDRLREVASVTPATVAPAPGQASALYPAPGGITVTQPDGSQVTFYAQSGGQCTSGPYTLVAGQYCALPQDVGAALSYNSSTQVYTFTQQPGSTLTYNASGQFTGESNAAGDTLSIAYGTPVPGSGNCPSTATSCETITSASGRALVIGLNASNLATSVTDPLGRRWTYAYTGSQLTSVTDPMSNVTSYGYDTGNASPLLASDLVKITRPNGQTGGPDAGANTAIAYDGSGRVTSVTDPMGFATTYDWTGFNPSTGSGVITVHDPDGNKTVYYYSQGSLAAQSAWTGSALTSEQDFVPDQAVTSGDNSAGTQLVTSSADGNGNITATSYDTAGNPITVIAPDGVGSQVATTTQQSTGLNLSDCSQAALASSTCSSSPGPSPVAPGGVISPPSSAPPLGLTWTLYDTDGNELYTTTGVYEPGSNTAAYSQTTYQLFKNNSVTLGGNNITCSATPPTRSLPCATINADGVVTQLGYDSQGDLTSSSTPDGNPGSEAAATTYGYDGDGEQTSMTAPDGNLTGANAGNYTTITTWNADAQKTAVSQGDGTGHTVTPRTTNNGYDADGNQTTVQDARGFTTTTTFNAGDRAALVTDPDGNATLTCYDGAGNVTQAVPPAGVAASSLTPSSCPSSYPSGYGNRLASDTTTYTYNGLGQKTQMTTPAPAGQSGSEATSYAYDANGNLTQTTAPPATNGGSSQVTVDTYTSTGQLATETTGSGTSAAATVSYCYDPNGDKTAVVYADGNTSGAAPCEAASPWVVSSSSYPTQASYQTTYSYDSAKELVSATAPATTAAPNGATTSETYDAAGNTLTRTDPNGVITTWTYTPLNKPATISYSGGSAHSVSYGYDADGNRTSMSDATGSPSYVFDSFGELTSATNGAGQATGYGYNADGQVSSITYPLPSNTWATTSTVNYTYDNADLPTKVTDFNNNAITIGNTADGLPNSAGLGSSGDTISTTYDNTDTPSVIALKNGTTTLQSFTYTDSPAGTILNEADTPTSSLSPAVYTYDAKSRVTSMTPGTGSTLNYGFDASSNLTTLPTGGSGSYDKAGELSSSALSGTTTSYTYNADGQRLTSKQGSTTITSGTWNGAGQLTAYSDSAANMTAATYNGDGQRATATTGAATQDFVWNTVSPIPQAIMDSGNAYIYDGGIAPAEQVNLSTGAITYLVTDSLGSVRGTVNSSGTLTGTTGYDAWGNPETTGGLTAATPFGYAGGYTDPTGLVYLLNRYYDPQTGQFFSVDPAITQTLQPYDYAGENPVSNADPTGLYLFHVTSGWITFTMWFGFHWTEMIADFGPAGAVVLGLFGLGCGPGAPICIGIIELHAAYIVGEAWWALENNGCLFVRGSYFGTLVAAGVFHGTWCADPGRRRRR